MENIQINTTQNVYIQHEIANVGERIVSQLLDFVFIFIYFFGWMLISGLFSKIGINFIAYVLLIPVLFYSFLFEVFFQGQSPGKMIMKIKVVKIDGSEPSIGSLFIRWIFRLIDIMNPFYGSIAIVTILFNGKGQRLGDIVAKTTVIKIKRQANLSNTIFKILPDNYQLVFEEVKKLSESDIKTINDVLLHFRRNNSKEALNLLFITAREIEKKAGIRTNLHPKAFLETILTDYNYIHLNTN